MDHPVAKKYRETGGLSSPGNGPDEPGTVSNMVPPASMDDIPVYVAHQMHTATSPEEQLAAILPLVSLEKRLLL